jgi:serine/threonine protein kinase/tetratricopeptide (TPR) repeat protein
MPASDPYWRVKQLFVEALDKPPGEQREAFLRSACGEETELLLRINEMLGAHARASAVLPAPGDAPAVGLAATIHSDTIAAAASERVGEMIGPYKLLERIGEGGMGAVWMAEQREPIRRTVALKLIKLGMDTRNVIARFEAERQALALMDHPNIARVFDAGATDSGRPYFAMELVKGVPITQYCDEHRLDVQRRLELFTQVCGAVQHAHQKGLIHRDIKPSNVLVATHDGDRPLAKVIDFGIAKATQARLTEKTLFTEFRQLIGTPEYMSPEQAVGDLDIDTRSDVYALGVLLYELLVGATPFDGRELRSKAYAEMQRIIREVDPPRPSTRLSSLATLPAVAARRGTEPGKLGATVRGELDWIVMKCLEKDRTRRYATANGLAADVQRYLADEPVTAAAPSRAYRLRKFVRRNRAAVLTATTVLACALAGAGLYIHNIRIEQRRTQDALAEAQRQRNEAQTQAAIAEAVGQFQSDMLSSADPDRLLGDKVTVVQVITAAAAELDAGKLTSRPLVEAAVRQTIGRTLLMLGRYDDAEPHLRKALELRRGMLPPAHPRIALSVYDLAQLAGFRGEQTTAERLHREALGLQRAALPPNDPMIAASLTTLAELLRTQGRLDEAERLAREAMDVKRRSDVPNQAAIASSIHILASVLASQRRLADADELLRESLRMRREALRAGHPDIISSLNSLAQVVEMQERLDEAEPLYREALGLARASLPQGHRDTGTILHNFAQLLQHMGRLAEAEPLLREALEIERKSLPPGHPSIANTLNGLALVRHRQGDRAEAESLYREALAILREMPPPGSPFAYQVLCNLGAVLRESGKPAEGEPFGREAVAAAARALPSDDWRTGVVHEQLGRTLAALDRRPEAEIELLEAERIVAAARYAPRPALRRVTNGLVKLYYDWDKAEPGRGYAAKAAEWRARLPATQPTTAPAAAPATLPATAESDGP